MGNDGGSIPKRRELVKEAARLPSASELKEAAAENLNHSWSFCPLSSSAIDPTNTVSDWRGRLYNYESILQWLLPSPETSIPETQEEAFKSTGIRNLKDVLKLKFTIRKDEKGREFRACPISLKELGAATKALYIVPCGHVFAEVAMKEIFDSEGTEAEHRCPECSEVFETENVIPILPSSESEIARLASRLESLKARGLSHTLKKDKSNGKKKRKAEEGANGDIQNSNKKEKKDKESGIESRINNASTASLTAKVLAEQEEKSKRRKIAEGHKRSEAVR
ncbi:Rtf2 RING-finger-domain-containing protein [Pseudomassariella vexata]|uniref:Rtf2 RING-finger-domain-containing protein n=1 Tax=Pseudomassariella vexata TaxID=1141098 RepID=A0A1Y2DQV9_9PEZI|nr:Rtf2 RING-finger-domain-containing protein [Pseudomassariella vexata]ORY61496.1 Rtf2 RING-finger-domain-containing protein [Pseudomassariella vexata]